jgi:hypothetical protein
MSLHMATKAGDARFLLQHTTSPLTLSPTVYLAQKGKNQSHESSRGEGSKRGRGKKNFKGKGVGIIPVRDLIFNVSIAKRIGHMK